MKNLELEIVVAYFYYLVVVRWWQFFLCLGIVFLEIIWKRIIRIKILRFQPTHHWIEGARHPIVSKPEIREAVKSAVCRFLLRVTIANLPNIGTLLVHKINLVKFYAALFSADYVLVYLNVALDAPYNKFIFDVVDIFEQP